MSMIKELPRDSMDTLGERLFTELDITWKKNGTIKKEHYYAIIKFCQQYVKEAYDLVLEYCDLGNRIVSDTPNDQTVKDLEDLIAHSCPKWLKQLYEIEKYQIPKLRQQPVNFLEPEELILPIRELIGAYRIIKEDRGKVLVVAQAFGKLLREKKIRVLDKTPGTAMKRLQTNSFGFEGKRYPTKVSIGAGNNTGKNGTPKGEKSLSSQSVVPVTQFLLRKDGTPINPETGRPYQTGEQIPLSTTSEKTIELPGSRQLKPSSNPSRALLRPIARRLIKNPIRRVRTFFRSLIGAVRTWRPAVEKTQLAAVRRPMSRRKFIAALGTGVVAGVVGRAGNSSEQHNHANIATPQPKTPTEPKKMPAPMQYDENFDKIYNEAAPEYVEKTGPFGDFRDPNSTKGVLHYTRLPTILLEALITNNAAEMHVFRNDFLLMQYSYSIAQGIIDYKTSQEGQQLDFVLFDQAHGLTSGAIRKHVDPYDGKTYIYDENRMARKIRGHIYLYFEEYKIRFGSLGFSYYELKHENKSDKHVTRFFTDANALFDSRVNELMEQRKQQGENSRNMLTEARYEMMQKMLYISIHLDDGETVTDNFNGPFFLLPSKHSSWTSRGKYLNKRREIGKAAGKYILARAKKYYDGTLSRRRQQLDAIRIARRGGTVPQKRLQHTAGFVGSAED